jgi:hypothetical protein
LKYKRLPIPSPSREKVLFVGEGSQNNTFPLKFLNFEAGSVLTPRVKSGRV